MFECSFEKCGEPSSEVELIVCKSVAVCFVSWSSTINLLFFFKLGDPFHVTQNPENKSVTTTANSGKPTYEVELTECKFNV